MPSFPRPPLYHRHDDPCRAPSPTLYGPFLHAITTITTDADAAQSRHAAESRSRSSTSQDRSSRATHRAVCVCVTRTQSSKQVPSKELPVDYVRLVIVRVAELPPQVVVRIIVRPRELSNPLLDRSLAVLSPCLYLR